MPSGFVFIKYADPPLTESSRDFFIPVTSNKTFQMRVLDISAIQSKRVTNSRWRDSVHVTPCVLTGILCSAGRISYCYRIGPVATFHGNSFHMARAAWNTFFPSGYKTQLHWKGPMASWSSIESCKREMLLNVFGSCQVLMPMVCYFLGNAWKLSIRKAKK